MAENTLFFKIYTKRVLFVFILILSLFFFTILRVAVLTSKDYSAVFALQNYVRLNVSNIRGTVFYCDKNPITNNKQKIFAAVSPTPEAIAKLSELLEGKEKEEALEKLGSGKPVLLEVENYINCKGIFCEKITVTENKTALHTIGYTDSNNNAVSGLELKFDNRLNFDTSAEFIFECDGKGRVLTEKAPVFEYDKSHKKSGIVTTLDSNIQKIAEDCGEYIKKGAVVISEISSGKLRAVASFPTFNLNNLKESVKSEDSPFLNRAINAYNVGSVFKPCVAAAGIENNKTHYLYNCVGKCKILDRDFHCHESNGHGITTLKNGIANSCNTYFYNYAFHIGQNEIYKMCKNLKFGSRIKLCDGMYASGGTLPSLESLTNKAQLANLSIGQGNLTLSPISLLTLYSAIANDGLYYSPYLVEGSMTNGEFYQFETEYPTRCMSEKTASILKESLREVFVSGTAKDYRPKTTTAAGKTATAQTGKFENGREICRSWFCGFFPFENPKYAIVVFSEDSTQQTKTSSEIFSLIADRITKNGY